MQGVKNPINNGNFMAVLKIYLIALSIFIILDLFWVGVLVKSFYKEQIGHLLADQIYWPAAIVFYLLFIGALLIFVILPGIEKHSLSQVVLYGAFFGLVTYATYDLTNFATMKQWTLTVTLVDIAWGLAVTASVSVVTYLVSIRFFV